MQARPSDPSASVGPSAPLADQTVPMATSDAARRRALKRWLVLVSLVGAVLAAPGVAHADTPWVSGYPFYANHITSGTDLYVYDSDNGVFRLVPDASTAYSFGMVFDSPYEFEETMQDSFNGNDGLCCGDPWPSCECGSDAWPWGGGGGGGTDCTYVSLFGEYHCTTGAYVYPESGSAGSAAYITANDMSPASGDCEIMSVLATDGSTGQIQTGYLNCNDVYQTGNNYVCNPSTDYYLFEEVLDGGTADCSIHGYTSLDASHLFTVEDEGETGDWIAKIGSTTLYQGAGFYAAADGIQGESVGGDGSCAGSLGAGSGTWDAWSYYDYGDSSWELAGTITVTPTSEQCWSLSTSDYSPLTIAYEP